MAGTLAADKVLQRFAGGEDRVLDAVAYAQAQNLINQGIQEGKQVLYNQGGVIEDVSSNMTGTDTSVGNGFMSI